MFSLVLSRKVFTWVWRLVLVIQTGIFAECTHHILIRMMTTQRLQTTCFSAWSLCQSDEPSLDLNLLGMGVNTGVNPLPSFSSLQIIILFLVTNEVFQLWDDYLVWFFSIVHSIGCRNQLWWNLAVSMEHRLALDRLRLKFQIFNNFLLKCELLSTCRAILKFVKTVCDWVMGLYVWVLRNDTRR